MYLALLTSIYAAAVRYESCLHSCEQLHQQATSWLFSDYDTVWSYL